MKIVIAGYKCPKCGCVMRYPQMNNNRCADCGHLYNGTWQVVEAIEE